VVVSVIDVGILIFGIVVAIIVVLTILVSICSSLYVEIEILSVFIELIITVDFSFSVGISI